MVMHMCWRHRGASSARYTIAGLGRGEGSVKFPFEACCSRVEKKSHQMVAYLLAGCRVLTIPAIPQPSVHYLR